MDFKNTPPKWDAAGAEPSADLQRNGFSAGYKPPAAFFNYLFHTYTECIKELQGSVNDLDNHFFKELIKADTTEEFFLDLMGQLEQNMANPQTTICGCTHDGKDFYFGNVYRNGSLMWGYFYGALNKVGYFVSYDTRTKSVTFRNLPNENFSALNTDNKANLVGAINELHAAMGQEFVYSNFTADTLGDYLKSVCTFVCDKTSGGYIYRGAWTGNNYYTGLFYKTSTFVFGTVFDHNGKEYYCHYTPDSDAFTYKTLTAGNLQNLTTTAKDSLVAAINELDSCKVEIETISIGSNAKMTADLLNQHLDMNGKGGFRVIRVNGNHNNVGTLLLNTIAAQNASTATYGYGLYISYYNNIQSFLYDQGTWIESGKMGDMRNLATEDKSSLVSAINELVSDTDIGSFGTQITDLDVPLSLSSHKTYIHRFASDAAKIPTTSSGFAITYVHSTSAAVQYIFLLNGTCYVRKKTSSDTISDWTTLYRTIRTGTAAPDNSVGVDGDIYIQIVG